MCLITFIKTCTCVNVYGEKSWTLFQSFTLFFHNFWFFVPWSQTLFPRSTSLFTSNIYYLTMKITFFHHSVSPVLMSIRGAFRQCTGVSMDTLSTPHTAAGTALSSDPFLLEQHELLQQFVPQQLFCRIRPDRLGFAPHDIQVSCPNIKIRPSDPFACPYFCFQHQFQEKLTVHLLHKGTFPQVYRKHAVPKMCCNGTKIVECFDFSVNLRPVMVFLTPQWLPTVYGRSSSQNLIHGVKPVRRFFCQGPFVIVVLWLCLSLSSWVCHFSLGTARV